MKLKEFIHGMDELRTLVNFGNHANESAFDGLDLLGTVKLLRACLALDLETWPDQLTQAERRYAAKHGKVSTACLRRRYKEEGYPETGIDWEGRKGA
jgi:hypothetical protein